MAQIEISERRNALSNVRERLAGLPLPPAVRRTAPWLGGLAATGALALAVLAMSAEPARVLYAGASPDDMAAMASALDAAAIPYTLAEGSGAPSVSASDYHRARLALASEGLPRRQSSEPAISALPLGASRAVEGEHLRIAREAELARTIEAIDAVTSARVHIAPGNDSPFVRERATPSASVMLRLDGGGQLADDQVSAITHLVAASVPGLSAAGVTVSDQSGRLLSAEGGLIDPRVRLQRTIEDNYRRAIDTLLGPVLGEGNYTREVTVELDFTETQSTRDVVPQGSAVLRNETGETSVDPASAAPGGIPGALSNTPPPAAIASTTPPPPVDPLATAPGAARRSESYNRDFALGREVSVSRQGTPRIARLSVALALKGDASGRARGSGDRAEIERLLKGAVGFNEARGDQLVVSSRPFAAGAAAPTTRWWENEALRGWAGPLGAVLVAIIALLAVVRPLLLRSKRGEANSGTVAADPSPLALPAPFDMATEAGAVRALVAEDPARAAQIVRAMMRSGEGAHAG